MKDSKNPKDIEKYSKSSSARPPDILRSKLKEAKSQEKSNANSVESQKQNSDISHKRGNIANHDRIKRAYEGNPYPEDYDRHKKEIHEKLNDLEKNYNKLKQRDQQLEDRFKIISWLKSRPWVKSRPWIEKGVDICIKNFDKREIEFNQSRWNLRETIDRLENTVQGNPKGYAHVSIGEWIKLHPQDKKEFQQQIDRIKLSDPKPGDKQTSRQKRFEEQESKRFQTMEENRIGREERSRKEQSKEIDKLKEGAGRMLKESKEYMNRAARGKNAGTLLKAAKQVSDRVSLWKRGEKMQYSKVHKFPDLADKCKNIRKYLNAYNKELNDMMKKKFGTQWTLCNVKSR